MIIYPPLINSVVPAFTENQIKIPFTHNPAVDKSQVKGFGLVIKDYKSSTQLGEDIQQYESNDIEDLTKTKFFDLDEGWVIFNSLEGVSLEKNQYYKLQIYYIDDDIYNIQEEAVQSSQTYALSTAVITRYLKDNPKIYIKELETNKLNTNKISYQGIYERPAVSEPSYSHQFVVADSNGNILQDSGIIIGNNNTVKEEQSPDDVKQVSEIHIFDLLYELDSSKIYTITYYITTVNGYTNSISYKIINKPLLNSYYTGHIKVEQTGEDYDNGCTTISLVYNKENLTNGNFVLWRSDKDQTKWDKLLSFNMYEDVEANYSWKDYSIEQGITYYYAISQQSVEGEQSKKIISNSITPYFEGMYLSDSTRQLKIAFNPKVSSLKETIQESKIETLGSKYPYFFRNSQIKYKEIPISGLISYQQDENNLFILDEEIGLDTAAAGQGNSQSRFRTTNLVDYNYTAERKFKMAVLEWLNNGEPKMFRSAAEGNFIIRLMNISLSPDDKLGRMLHTFTATGYEIDECSINNLKQKNLIKFDEVKYNSSSITQTSIYNIGSTLPADLEEIDNKVVKVKNNGTFSKISWVNTLPNYNEILEIDQQQFRNLTGVYNLNNLTAQSFSYSTLTSNSSLYLEYSYDNFDPTVIIDKFSDMADNSTNILISIPVGKTIEEVLGERNIYQIFSVIILRDPYYLPSEVKEDLQITINDQTIDFSSQEQFRYYDNIQSIGEKGKGLHVDLYARIQNKEVNKQ